MLIAETLHVCSELWRCSDWGHAKDYIKGMWLMVQKDEPDDYVLSTGECHSVREFIEEVSEMIIFAIQRLPCAHIQRTPCYLILTLCQPLQPCLRINMGRRYRRRSLRTGCRIGIAVCNSVFGINEMSSGTVLP